MMMSEDMVTDHFVFLKQVLEIVESLYSMEQQGNAKHDL